MSAPASTADVFGRTDKNGANTKQCDRQQLLISAALQDFDTVRFFIEVRGLHPDATVNGKPTAICYAALKKDRCLLRYLLLKGASTNIRDRMGMTPLHYAALGGCMFCISYLLSSGAHVNAVNMSGKTPLAMALENPRLSNSVRLLKRHGAKILNVGHMSAHYH
ncbi:MAG: ankyrin repeat domain-containing protein [Pseudomonadota bacterium]